MLTQNVVGPSSIMLQVLSLFLLPVGGGIPAGVLLASNKGLPWPMTAGLYLFSDIVLALAFEPILRILVVCFEKIPFLAHLTGMIKRTMARRAPLCRSASASPFTLVMIAFGVDPMTGRASALAAGHGFLAGWIIAISGDMLYYAVISLTTLSLSTYFQDPNTVILIVLGAMIVVPTLVRQVRSKQISIPSCPNQKVL